MLNFKLILSILLSAFSSQAAEIFKDENVIRIKFPEQTSQIIIHIPSSEFDGSTLPITQDQILAITKKIESSSIRLSKSTLVVHSNTYCDVPHTNIHHHIFFISEIQNCLQKFSRLFDSWSNVQFENSEVAIDPSLQFINSKVANVNGFNDFQLQGSYIHLSDISISPHFAKLIVNGNRISVNNLKVDRENIKIIGSEIEINHVHIKGAQTSSQIHGHSIKLEKSTFAEIHTAPPFDAVAYPQIENSKELPAMNIEILNSTINGILHLGGAAHAKINGLHSNSHISFSGGFSSISNLRLNANISWSDSKYRCNGPVFVIGYKARLIDLEVNLSKLPTYDTLNEECGYYHESSPSYIWRRHFVLSGTNQNESTTIKRHEIQQKQCSNLSYFLRQSSCLVQKVEFLKNW